MINHLLTLVRFYLTCIILLIFGSIQAQNIKWKDSPGKTYVFEINNKEAEQLLLSNPQDSLVLKMLHTPVASYRGRWENPPKQGHFIFANIYKNNVSYHYSPIMPFQVFLVKEYGVFTLQVADKEGNVRDNAKVRIKGRWLFFEHNTAVEFDRQSKTYTINDESDKKDRILTVELNKFKAVFNLEKHFVNPWYNYNNYSGNSPDFYSYMITDKNKYKPGETVRFKSYALSNRKSPIKKDLEVWMNTERYNYKKITTVSPYNPGGFAGEIQLHDSLKLKLNQSYGIQLRDDKKRIVASTQFKYEDYELYDSKLEVKLKSHTHYYPDTNQVEIKATDANGLLLQDVKADILIRRQSVTNIYTDVLIMPDTLMYKRISLDNVAPTKVDIPFDLFEKTDCSYEVQVQIFTFDNQRLTSNNHVTFYRSNLSLYYSTRNDTIRFDFFELGKEKKVKAKLRYNFSEESKWINLPYEEPFDQKIRSYNIEISNPAYKQNVYTENVHSGLDLAGGISTDSFNVKLVNPLALDISWYIYQGDKLLEKGSGKEFDFKYPNTDLEVTHYVEMFYLMGDEQQVFRRMFIPKSEYLSIDTNLPDRVYPGQKIDATITVQDTYGKPVKNADLTAFAVNTLLEHNVPDLPYYGATPRNREQRSSYSIKEKNFSFSSPLDYKYWNKHASLDTMQYYQFTYPWDVMFKHTVNTPDSTTQFAPYVMRNGNAVDIYVIEQNGQPIYFSWTEQPQGFSFLASDTTKQVITLRLPDRALRLDSMRFEKGKKTILSIDLDHLPANVKEIRLNYKDNHGRYTLTGTEISNYTRLISRIPVKRQNFTYLQQGARIYPVYHNCLMNYKPEVLIGPFPQGKTKYTDGIEYKHEGGFSYQFEDNVVYKYPHKVYPEYLNFLYRNDFSKLNDFCLTPKFFHTIIEKCKNKPTPWFPRNIYISQYRMNMNFRFPVEKDSTGVSNLLFRNHSSNKIYFPDRYENGVRKYSEIPDGVYDVILLYNNGKYLKYDSIPLRINAYIDLNMNKLHIHQSDSLSRKWLSLRTSGLTASLTHSSMSNYAPVSFFATINRARGANTVTGTVFDMQGEPLIGVTVMIKGTTNGTITDIDGHFEIDIEHPKTTLVFNFIGYKKKELDVTFGSDLKVVLEDDNQILSEVVVIGYGSVRKSNMTGSVSSVSQNDALPQSPPEEVEETDSEDGKIDDAEDKLYAELLQLNGLRSNFSDVGFWEPRLFTDRKGKASFSVTFPDNITKWDAVVYAMNRKLKTGTLRKSIKSYKPLMAELRTPQFLIVGDSSYFAGNIRNYTKDKEIEGNLLFALNKDTLENKSIRFEASHQDYVLVNASETDSISATYLFTRNDGYNDGEKRSIPIRKQGTEIAEGSLSFLRNGDKVNAVAEKGEDVYINITAKQLDVYMDATYYLTGYEYACNEQLASKLIGLLNYKIYKTYLGEKFENDKNINEIIKRLVENRNDRKLWSWWGRSSETSFWMSAHIMRALRMAKEAGYTVNLDLRNVETDYMDTKSYRYTSLSDIQILQALSEWGTQQNYEAAVNYFEDYIRKLEVREDSIAKKNKTKRWNSYLNEKLLLWEIRQKQDIGYSSDSIKNYLKKDVLGAVYCDDGLERNWYSNSLITTLTAYRIIKKDSTLMDLKEAMQMYILGTKDGGWNTYQASSAVSAILPDLVAEATQINQPARIALTGKENKDIKEFPYKTKLTSGERLGIEKKSGMPVIYTAYKMKRVTEENKGEAFEVSTSISSGDTIRAGDIVTLTVEVKVKQKNAEHVMIEVPIPAGCSYASKPNYFYGREVHREYFKERTVIFCQSLPMGTYKFSIQLLPRYTGKYFMNPAKAEMMYFPVINANNSMRKIEIEERK